MGAWFSHYVKKHFTTGKGISAMLQSLMYVFAGYKHFTSTDYFIKFVPPWVPFHKACVYISGVAEIVLGTLLWFPYFKKLAGYGLLAMLVAVFPANIYCYTHEKPRLALNITKKQALVRLPF
jgi:uncharacterized membrane protein